MKKQRVTRSKPPPTLRERTEAVVRASRTDIARMPAKEIQRLVDELQVHQLEREMENEELRGAQAEQARAKATLEAQVTERTESLRASEERFRGLFATMQEGFFLAELISGRAGKPVDFRFLDVNPALLKNPRPEAGSRGRADRPGVVPQGGRSLLRGATARGADRHTDPCRGFQSGLGTLLPLALLLALRQSEERYRTLFNTLIEGFCIIEMVFNARDRPVDYRFLEVNLAFAKQTGWHHAQGRLMRDLAPDHEARWLEIYGKVAVTGEPARFVNEARALDRWYEVSAFRFTVAALCAAVRRALHSRPALAQTAHAA